MALTWGRDRFNSAGLTLVELIITAGLASVVLIAVGAMTAQLIRQSRNLTTTSQLDTFRRNLIAVSLDPGSWSSTRTNGDDTSGAKPSHMTCLNNGSECMLGGNPITNQPFALYDAKGNLIYDGTSATQGVDLSGNRCDTYVAPPHTPTGGCVFHYALTWTANCPAGSCTYPQILITATLTMNLANSAGTIINPNNYSIPKLYRSPR